MSATLAGHESVREPLPLAGGGGGLPRRSSIGGSGKQGLMKIAQVAPLYESVPPKYYGGTERVVSYLTEELVRQGHDVTLFAIG